MFRLIRGIVRRLFWLGTGAGVGFGSAMWIRHRLLRAADRYAPRQVTRTVATGVRRAGGDVRSALSEGRAEMQAREAELRRDLAPGPR